MSSRLLTSSLRQSQLSKKLIQSIQKPQVLRSLVNSTPSLVNKSIKFYSSSTSAVNSPANQLNEVLKSELKISSTIPNELDPLYQEYLTTTGFEVIEVEGQSNVQLKKTLDNGEVIRIFFDIDEVTDIPLNEDQFGEEEGANENIEDIEDEVDSLDSLLCNVKVLIENPSKNNGLFLNLFLQGSESSFMIDFVNHQSDVSSFLQNDILAKGEFINKFKYQGPRFSDLDESVQTGFETYLDSKGVNDNLAEFIISFSEFKEEKEYRKWLSDLSSYLK